MALDNTAADAALDIWIASLSPAPADPEILRTQMRPLIRAVYESIRNNATVNIVGTCSTGPIAGTGTIS